jgi:hypothetical protein
LERAYVKLAGGLIEAGTERLGGVLEPGLGDVGLGLLDALLGHTERARHTRIRGELLERGQERLQLLHGLHGGVVVLLVLPRLDEVLLLCFVSISAFEWLRRVTG